MALSDQDATASPAVRMQDVETATDDGRPILHAVDLTVERAAWLWLVGPSGAGKSSLLRLVNRLDEPAAGRIDVLGRDLRQWPVRALRRRVGMVFQRPVLVPATVRDNLLLPLRFGREETDAERAAGDALGRVSLPVHWLDRRIDGLSAGERQRVALARTLMTRPEILLLDEPTASVDVPTAHALLDELRRTQRETGVTVLIATHRLSEPRQMGGRTAVVMGGRIVAVGEVHRLREAPPTDEVRRFLEDAHG